MSESRRQPQTSPNDAAQDARVRAERVRAMLARWEREDVADEPDWSADTVASLALRPPASDAPPRR